MFRPATISCLVASLIVSWILFAYLGWAVDPRILWAIEWVVIAVVVAVSVYKDFLKHPNPRRRND